MPVRIKNTMKIKKFTFNLFSVNSFVLYDETKECIIVDPGCRNQEEREELIQFIETHQLKPVKLVNTHCHVDHVAGNAFVKEKWSVPICAHSEDISNLHDATGAGEFYGMPIEMPPNSDTDLKGVSSITFGNSELKLLHLPGHSKGSIALVSEKDGFAIVGDVLFRGAIGRTDLNGGSLDELMHSIKNVLFKLDEQTVVYSGHGPETTIEQEKRTNPFLLEL